MLSCPKARREEASKGQLGADQEPLRCFLLLHRGRPEEHEIQGHSVPVKSERKEHLCVTFTGHMARSSDVPGSQWNDL